MLFEISFFHKITLCGKLNYTIIAGLKIADEKREGVLLYGEGLL